MSARLVESQADLLEVCAQFRSQEWIALDTEFMRERTYYAQLCLVQIAVPGFIACIDPLRVGDVAPLLDLIFDTNILKVMHAARQDLEVFYDLRRRNPGQAVDSAAETGLVPRPVFDTQIAAACLGYDDQIGYAALVKEISGVVLDKTHTRTDWSARPLKAEQLSYAADDVRYLCDVYLHLAASLAESGRSEWPRADFARLTDPQLYENDPRKAWQRIGAGERLGRRGQAILRELAEWRENTAQTSNLPRNWVMRDAEMIELARSEPRDIAELAAVSGIGDRARQKWGGQILSVIATGGNASGEAIWQTAPVLSPDQMELCRRMAKEVDRIAHEQRVSSALLGTRREIQRLVLGEPDVRLLQGWRRELVGNALLSMLAARSARVSPSAHD